MQITSAKYSSPYGEIVCINAVIDGKLLFVPLDPANTDYAEIMRQAAAGDLTIADAE